MSYWDRAKENKWTILFILVLAGLITFLVLFLTDSDNRVEPDPIGERQEEQEDIAADEEDFAEPVDDVLIMSQGGNDVDDDEEEKKVDHNLHYFIVANELFPAQLADWHPGHRVKSTVFTVSKKLSTQIIQEFPECKVVYSKKLRNFTQVLYHVLREMDMFIPTDASWAYFVDWSHANATTRQQLLEHYHLNPPHGFSPIDSNDVQEVEPDKNFTKYWKKWMKRDMPESEKLKYVDGDVAIRVDQIQLHPKSQFVTIAKGISGKNTRHLYGLRFLPYLFMSPWDTNALKHLF